MSLPENLIVCRKIVVSSGSGGHFADTDRDQRTNCATLKCKTQAHFYGWLRSQIHVKR